MENQDKKYFTVQERIQWYQGEIIKANKRLQFCHERLAKLLEQESNDMAKEYLASNKEIGRDTKTGA